MTGTAHVVLNTRPREQAAELSRLLTAAGLGVLEAPAIETIPAWDPLELEFVRRDLAAGAFDWIVLASQNAGRVLLDELRRSQMVVCGAATARALGLRPAVSVDRFSASAALEALAPRVRRGQRVLVPRAAEGGAALADGVHAMGARVDAPIAYRTVAVEPAALEDVAARLRAHQVDAVAVCSPSAVLSLVAAVGHEALAQSQLVCLGETTAEAVREAGLQVAAVAHKTTMAALVEAVLWTLVPREVVA